jgi:hypothetical protein
MYKLRNVLGEDLWLIDGHKGAAVRKEVQPRVRKGLLEPLCKTLREEGIIFSPQQQDRVPKARETPSRLQGIAVGDRLQEAGHVTACPWKMKQWMEERIEFLQLWATMGKGCHKETLRGPGAEHPRQEIGEPEAPDPCPIMKGTDQRREKLLKGVTIGEDQTADPFWRVCNDQLTHGPPGIIADQGHLLQIECLQKISDQASDPKRTEIRIWMEGIGMSTQREIGSNTAKV